MVSLQEWLLVCTTECWWLILSHPFLAQSVVHNHCSKPPSSCSIRWPEVEPSLRDWKDPKYLIQQAILAWKCRWHLAVQPSCKLSELSVGSFHCYLLSTHVTASCTLNLACEKLVPQRKYWTPEEEAGYNKINILLRSPMEICLCVL